MLKKLFIFTILALLFGLFPFSLPKNALANTPACQDNPDKCPVCKPIDPPALNTDSRKANFTIPLKIEAIQFDETGHGNYQAEFDCGIGSHLTIQPIPESNGRISVDLDKTGFQLGPICEFLEGTNSILIRTYQNGNPGPILCRAPYIVSKNESLNCTLDIKSSTPEITSASTVKFKVSNGYGNIYLFIDNKSATLQGKFGNEIKRNEEYTVIPEFMTPGRHTIIISTNRLDPAKDVCSGSYDVGTPAKPGTVAPPRPPGPATTPAPTKEPAFAGGLPCDGEKGIQTAIGCIHTKPTEFVKDFVKFIIAISGGFAFLLMLLGAFQMLTSGGNPDSLNAGRERLTSAIIGLLFVIFAILLLQVIGVGILDIPGFGKQSPLLPGAET